MRATDELTIGEVALRSGVTSSALRFYETQGLIASRRTDGNQRRYVRDVLRRVAVIQAGVAAGIPLRRIAVALDALPAGRTPTRRDWQRLSAAWRDELDDRIRTLQGLRDDLDSCIGCGCLSLRRCVLFNPRDAAAIRGAGARYLLGDDPGGVRVS